MRNFYLKYKVSIIGAVLGILFHFILIGLVLLGKGQAFLLLIFMDFPITIIWTLFFGVVGVGGSPVVWTYFIGGTLMYAALGWIVGGFYKRKILSPNNS